MNEARFYIHAIDFNINVINNEGKTKLHTLLEKCDHVIFEILDQMLALGADCNIADQEGCTPISWQTN